MYFSRTDSSFIWCYCVFKFSSLLFYPKTLLASVFSFDIQLLISQVLRECI